MPDNPKADPDDHIHVYFDPEIAKNLRGLPPTGREEQKDASRFDGKKMRARGNETYGGMSPRSECPP